MNWKKFLGLGENTFPTEEKEEITSFVKERKLSSHEKAELAKQALKKKYKEKIKVNSWGNGEYAIILDVADSAKVLASAVLNIIRTHDETGRLVDFIANGQSVDKEEYEEE
jgi:hypothetical protein